ncbi:MAG: hypothetical protein M1395_08860 [Bacteroidetes bacterium]|nr:hypothetical protein [Bacteroidota bacterium]
MLTIWGRGTNVRLSLTAIVLFLSAAFIGCSKSNSGNPVSTQQMSTVSGEVYGQQGLAKRAEVSSINATGIQGATVTLAQVQADGSLKTVSVASSKTDASGRFSVSTDLTGVSNLVAVATEGTTQWEAVVSAAVAQGTTVECQPLTDQTTVQAQIFAKVFQDGKSGDVTTADIQLYVSPSVAASVMGNASATAQLATALEAEADAQSNAFLQLGASQAQLQTASASRTQVQIALESSLYTAAGDSLGDYLALQSYYTGSVAAYVATGIPLNVCAKAEQASSAALVSFSSGISTNVEFSVEQSASLIRAVLMGQAISTEFSAGGATQGQIALVTAANNTLLVMLEAAVTPDDMAAAFASYHNTVLAQLEAMAGTNSSAIGSMDGTINATGGLRTSLQSAVSSATTASAIVTAYMTFYNSVGTMMHGMTGMNAAQLDAATQIMALIDSNI